MKIGSWIVVGVALVIGVVSWMYAGSQLQGGSTNGSSLQGTSSNGSNLQGDEMNGSNL